MVRNAIPLLVVLLVFAGCAGDRPGDARRPAEPTAKPTVGQVVQESTQAGPGGAAPPYITIGESETEEAGVRTAQVIVTAKETSGAELRRIVEDLKAKYRNHVAVSVEIMDGPAGYGRAGTATITNTDEGARRAGFPEGVPNEDGYGWRP